MPVNAALKLKNMRRLFVYVDGSDLEEVEHDLVRRFEKFIDAWGISDVRLIDKKFDRTPDLREDDLSDWNLGLNVEVAQLPIAKLSELIQFLADTSKQTGREFVIGTWDERSQISEDWCFIGDTPKQSDIEFLTEQLQ